MLLLILSVALTASSLPVAAQVPPFDLVRVLRLLPAVDPVFLAPAPGGGDRLFVAEKSGLIRVFRPATADTGRVFLDARPQARDFRPETGLLGMAFHPQFAENGRFFLHYSGRILQSVLSEFRVSADDPDRADTWERIILEVPQPSDMHNGGQIEFGPDGYLYMSLGDGSAPDDPADPSQDRTNLLGSILRMDVDVGDDTAFGEGPSYGIPLDNPFVGNDRGWREEIWAFGFRNPWRFSFDPLSDLIWVGDVGDRQREEIDLVERGGNYGWGRMEGTVCLDETGCDDDSLLLPAFEYGRDEGAAVIGGFVYQGQLYADLAGAYLFADFATRKVWALRPDGRSWRSELLAVAEKHILALGSDAEGEVLVLTGNAIYGLEPAPDRELPPPRLSQTRFFADLTTQEPAAGVVPYEVNAPLWSDGAGKRRYLALPPGGLVQFSPTGAWHLPAGTTMIKSFYVGERIVETRLLIKRPTHPGWDGYSYQWDDEGREAFLLGVAETGEYDVVESGEVRSHRHLFPSPSQCGDCHTPTAGYLLGVRTDQLNRDGQIQAWGSASLFSAELPLEWTWARLPAPADESAAVEERARAYLAANCASCHRPGHGIRATFDVRFATPLAETGLLDSARLGHLGAGVGSRLVMPGEPLLSVLYLRMLDVDRERMPPLATARLDTDAADLVRRWIERLNTPTSITSAALPPGFALFPPYPNPGNSRILIPFRLASTAAASLELFDLAGQKLETLFSAVLPAGEYVHRWHDDALASGVYLVRLTAGSRSEVRKMTLLK